MKIYISEKDFDTCGEKIETFNDVDLGLFDSVWKAYDIVETIERGAIITPLEKHDAEISANERKKVIDEIDKLLKTLKDDYSHLCKTQKEANQETCRYEGVCRVQNELKKLSSLKGE